MRFRIVELSYIKCPNNVIIKDGECVAYVNENLPNSDL